MILLSLQLVSTVNEELETSLQDNVWRASQAIAPEQTIATSMT